MLEAIYPGYYQHVSTTLQRIPSRSPSKRGTSSGGSRCRRAGDRTSSTCSCSPSGRRRSSWCDRCCTSSRRGRSRCGAPSCWCWSAAARPDDRCATPTWRSTSTSTARRRDAAGWRWRRARCSSATSASASGRRRGEYITEYTLQFVFTVWVLVCVFGVRLEICIVNYVTMSTRVYVCGRIRVHLADDHMTLTQCIPINYI